MYDALPLAINNGDYYLYVQASVAFFFLLSLLMRKTFEAVGDLLCYLLPE
jgi:hypothetical protein